MTIEMDTELREKIRQRAKEADLNSQQYARRVLAEAVAQQLVFRPVAAPSESSLMAAEPQPEWNGGES